MSYTGSEQDAVQNPLLDYVQETTAEYTTEDGTRLMFQLGWDYVSSEEAMRMKGGKEGLVFREVFINQMQKLNPDFMDNIMAEELIKNLERISPTKEGNLTAWEYLKGLKTVFVPYEKRERNVTFMDTENIDRNVFQVTDEFTFSNGRYTNRFDVVFLINGVPIFLVETKAAHKLEGIAEALDQVRRYHRQSPEMLVMMQIYALTHIVKFYYSATWNHTHKLLYNWKDESAGDNFEALVKTFFDKQRVVNLISNFILFTREDDELKKIILRPHQMRAVNKLVARAGDKSKQRGLVWHTQGSGKTYTMITTSELLMKRPEFSNPTVILLVDRNELETQLFSNLDALGIENFELADSKKELRQLLKNDRRGIIISTIHKFDGIKENINKRKNIFVLVDEAHRTTGGKLGNYLMGALPDATYIGFTGTPIDKTSHGKGTFLTFGKDDPPNGYLDKYSIGESIEDKTTVKLHYTLAPNELQIEQEVLERDFLKLSESEGVSDVEQLNKVLEKAVNLRNMLKNKERVEKITKYIAGHYRETVEPLGYKAFIVAVDREACALYKEELDKHLPPEYSEVVFSPGFNDPENLSKYHLSEDEEKRIRKQFRNPEEQPKILIVTEKLLTGFDAPVLYCMYLDKPMRDHVLLQAIARVNRPYEDDEGRHKPCGFILDFVGIFGNLKKALAFDSQDIEGIVDDIELLKERFKELIENARKNYLKILEGKQKDKAIETILEYFKDPEQREEFYEFYKELADIFDIISPDKFLRPFLSDYEFLTRIYKIIKDAYEPSISIDREFSRKTAELVQQHSHGGKIKNTLDVYEVDENTLKKLEESNASDTEKIFNLVKSVHKAITEKGNEQPYLISIGEKANNIVQSFKEKQKTTRETLDALKDVIEEMNQARKEQAEKNMADEIFTIFWELKTRNIKKPEHKANIMHGVIENYPHWYSSKSHEREVKKELYKLMLKDKDMKVPEVTKIVNEIFDNLKNRDNNDI